jgi:hypothetical protein
MGIGVNSAPRELPMRVLLIFSKRRCIFSSRLHSQKLRCECAVGLCEGEAWDFKSTEHDGLRDDWSQ